MKLTATGRWLLEAFLNKEPHGDDRELGAVVDVLQSVDEVTDIESSFEASLQIAMQLNLLTK